MNDKTHLKVQEKRTAHKNHELICNASFSGIIHFWKSFSKSTYFKSSFPVITTSHEKNICFPTPNSTLPFLFITNILIIDMEKQCSNWQNKSFDGCVELHNRKFNQWANNSSKIQR